MRYAFWLLMKILSGAGLTMALFGFGYWMTAQGSFAGLFGITFMFYSIPVFIIPAIAMLFKKIG